MTRSLQVMRDWLVECEVTIAAMESTSTYWKGAFYCLEDVMEVRLVNAAHIKAVSRRKTDVKDAEWIAQLLECGLLRPSFVPSSASTGSCSKAKGWSTMILRSRSRRKATVDATVAAVPSSQGTSCGT
jgi:hypothetical protein